MLAHLCPLGSPRALSPFIVLIELVRAVIRPITLSVRLAANIIAGHLLLCLLASAMPNTGTLIVSLLVLPLLLLLILESAVALIQAFVFTILSCLYTQEVESPHL